jgi:magnesium/cobalt transport protein CorA
VAIRVPQFRQNGRRLSVVEAAPDLVDAGDVRAFLYDAEAEDRRVEVDGIRVQELNERQLLWIDVRDLEHVGTVAASLGIAPDTVARFARESKRAEVLFHTDYFHVTVVVAERTVSGYEAATLDCVAGENWILTVHAQPIDFLERFDERIRGDSQLGRLDAPGLVATFLHEHVASYVREIEPFEIELDRLDLEVMSGRIDDDVVFRRLVDLRRRLARLRRLFAPHREIYGLLARPDFEMLSETESRDGFASLAERAEQAVQSLETAREMIVSSFEIYTTWTAHQTNKVMKLLTVASVTLLPPTLLASVMGMNSLPPMLGTATAFASTLTFMLVLVASVLVIARRRSWI